MLRLRSSRVPTMKWGHGTAEGSTLEIEVNNRAVNSLRISPPEQSAYSHEELRGGF